jgi:hypothetical protein
MSGASQSPKPSRGTITGIRSWIAEIASLAEVVRSVQRARQDARKRIRAEEDASVAELEDEGDAAAIGWRVILLEVDIGELQDRIDIDARQRRPLAQHVELNACRCGLRLRLLVPGAEGVVVPLRG